jgi:hypothetical protein
MKLYHYTDLASVIGIIKPNRALEFWGSRYDCMNDPFDCQYAYKQILPKIIKFAQKEPLEFSEKCELDVNPFVVSFSQKEDDFLMWRLYGAKVCIVLDSEYFDKPSPNCAVIKCEYVPENDDKRLYESYHVINGKIGFCRNIYAYTKRISTFIKHNAFEVEGEVRLASWDYYNKKGDNLCLPDCDESQSGIATTEFFSRVNENGKIILFKKFAIDGNALSGIIVHAYSRSEFSSIKNALRSVLIQNGFSSDVFENIQQTSAYPINLKKTYTNN